ncbi:MAG: hypothetical protein VZR73_14815, partial [Acutalibacteraceae bacterium]|nr:hypothetical protein [Acutalibacteraceae bacterium]
RFGQRNSMYHFAGQTAYLFSEMISIHDVLLLISILTTKSVPIRIKAERLRALSCFLSQKSSESFAYFGKMQYLCTQILRR